MTVASRRQTDCTCSGQLASATVVLGGDVLDVIAELSAPRSLRDIGEGVRVEVFAEVTAGGGQSSGGGKTTRDMVILSGGVEVVLTTILDAGTTISVGGMEDVGSLHWNVAEYEPSESMASERTISGCGVQTIEAGVTNTVTALSGGLLRAMTTRSAGRSASWRDDPPVICGGRGVLA